MNKRELLEKKELLENQMQSMLNGHNVETRAFTQEEDAEYKAKENELKSVINDLKDIEKRERKGVNTMEKIEVRQLSEAYIKGLANGNMDEFRTLTAEVEGSGITQQGNTIPKHLMEQIIKKVFEISEVANECAKVNAKGEVTFFVEGVDVFAKMLAENEEIAEEDLGKFTTVSLKDKRMGTMCVVTKNLLLNSPIVSEAYIVEKLATRIARQLERQVLKADGSGANMSRGILVNPAEENIVNGEAVGVISIDEIQEMVVSLKPQFLNGAKFYMNRATFGKVSKLKDGQGNYFLTYDVASSRPVYKLFGFEVVITDEMPNAETGAFPILFANMAEAMKLKVSQEAQIQVLREKYATRGAIGIVADFYGDCAVVNVEAYRVYKAK